MILLSPRQQQILSLVAEGFSNQAIAGRLGLTLNTVKSHLDTIYFRLGVHDRAGAVAVAMRAGALA